MNTMTESDEVEKLRKKYESSAGQEAIEQVHLKGKYTARERIANLVDANSFREFNLWAQPTSTGFPIDKIAPPGDAIVTGFAKIGGRPICIYAHDSTILAGTQASVQYWKACKTIDTSVRLGIPYVGIIDSGGVRIHDAFGKNSGVGISRNLDVWYSPAMASGIVPSISLILGASYAGTAYSPFLADVVFMVKKPYCYMSLASPELLKSVTHKDVTRDEIGAPELHAKTTGSCDYLGDTENDVIEKVRSLLSFLPLNCKEKPPRIDTRDPEERCSDSLSDLATSIPNTNHRYDMHYILEEVIDNGYLYELKGEYAKNIITAFGRLGGRPVGLVANNPACCNGKLDFRAVEKEARFVRYCDAFNIPLIFFVDTPGFILETQEVGEHLPRHAAMASYAICEATVPKITLFIGKCYNNAHLVMGSRLMGFDAILAWPTASIRHFGPASAFPNLYARNSDGRDSGGEVRGVFTDSALDAARLLIVEDIINPKETRPILNSLLEITHRKEVKVPDKRHGNIPM